MDKSYKDKESNKKLKTKIDGIKKIKPTSFKSLLQFDKHDTDATESLPDMYDQENRTQEDLLSDYDNSIEIKDVNMKIKKNNKNIKLSKLVKESLEGNPKLDSESKKKILTKIFEFSNLSSNIYRESSLVNTAKALSEIIVNAESLVLNESEEWFDKISIQRNMKDMKTLAEQFDKCSNEAQKLQERLIVLYEDCGHILSRYFDI